jgi:hypothetical protein
MKVCILLAGAALAALAGVLCRAWLRRALRF